MDLLQKYHIGAQKSRDIVNLTMMRDWAVHQGAHLRCSAPVATYCRIMQPHLNSSFVGSLWSMTKIDNFYIIATTFSCIRHRCYSCDSYYIIVCDWLSNREIPTCSQMLRGLGESNEGLHNCVFWSKWSNHTGGLQVTWGPWGAPYYTTIPYLVSLKLMHFHDQLW